MKSTTFAICAAAIAVATAATAQGEEKIHELRASPTTVHRGFFDASLKPVLTIDSGDIVRLWTTTGNPRYFDTLGVPKEKIPPELFAAFEGAPGEGRDDHTLTGPIAVRGAGRRGRRYGRDQDPRDRTVAADRCYELPRGPRLAAGGFPLFTRSRLFL